MNVTPATCLALMLSRSFLFLFGLSVQLVVQGLEADAEELGRSRLVAARMLQRDVNQLLFGLADGHAGRELVRAAREPAGGDRRRGARRGRGHPAGRERR